MIIKYKKLLNQIRDIDYPFLVCRTTGVEEYYKTRDNLNDEQVKELRRTREGAGGISLGSTYIIDLKKNISYRFFNHKELDSVLIFKYFYRPDNNKSLMGNLDIKNFLKIFKFLGIYEHTEDLEVHTSTPIKEVFIIPYEVARVCINSKSTKPLDLWVDIFQRYKFI